MIKYKNFFQKIKQSSFFSKARLKMYHFFVSGPHVDTEFLPGALEVSETPPSPVGRAVLWVIISSVVLAILWASLSKVDVVATAEGKLVPRGQVKLVQASEAGIVREIAVVDGQHVEQGQLLVSLDPTASTADEASLGQKLLHLQCELELWSALEKWSHNKEKQLPKLNLPEDASSTLRELYQERLHQESQVLMNGVGNLLGQIERLDAQEKQVEKGIKKYQEVLKIDSEISATMRNMYNKNVSSRHQWLVSEQQRIKTEQDLAATEAKLDELKASKISLTQEIGKTYSMFRSDILRKKSDVESEISYIRQELSKAARRNSLKELFAPVSGYVQQLSVHTVGGVVQGIEPLMVIVPDGTEMELEISILNKDIGFINEGQTVEVKLEAFPYTEYGRLTGEVEKISADAITLEDGNLLFPCTVRLLENNIIMNGKPVHLRAGMRGTGEIVLRKRRLISYFLSPLMQYKNESLRER